MARPRSGLRGIVHALGVHEGEGKLVASLIGFAALLGLTTTFVEVAAYALFLQSWDAGDLPWVYVGIAFAVTTASGIYMRGQERGRLTVFLPVVLAVTAVSLGLMWGGLQVSQARWLLLALPVWHEVVVFANDMVFWDLADRLFDIRQGKRLFGLIRSMEYLAGIIAGLSAAAFVSYFGSVHLIAVAAVTGLGLLALTTWIIVSHRKALSDDDDDDDDEGKAATPLLRSPLALGIFAIVALTIVEYYFLDLIFYDVAGSRYPDESSLAAFLGKFSALVNLLAWVTMGFVAPRVMARFGVRVSLLIMPVAIAVGAALAVGATGVGGLLFVLVAMSKVFDDVFTPALANGSVDVLYQALPMSLRGRTRSLAEGVIYPVSAGATGLLLLLLTGPLGLGTPGLLVGLLVVVAGCIVAAVYLPRTYRRSLAQALARRRLSGLTSLPDDAATMQLLEDGVRDPAPPRALYCLELLCERRPDEVGRILAAVMTHPAPDVRREVLRRVADLGQDTAAEVPTERVLALIDTDPDPRVCGEAVRTLAAVGGPEALGSVLVHLESDAPQLRLGAVVGLMRSGGIEGVLAAGQRFLNLSRSEDGEERAQAARIIGEVGIASFYQPLHGLLDDPERRVRRAAVEAARRLASPRLLESLLPCLRDPGTRAAASGALSAIGAPAIEVLVGAYREAADDTSLRGRIALTLGRIRAVDTLLELLGEASGQARHALAQALVACRWQAGEEHLPALHACLEETAHQATQATTLAGEVAASDADGLVVRGLEQLASRHGDTMLLILACMHEPEPIMRARLYLSRPSADKRAYALELLDNSLRQAEKALLLPLLEGRETEVTEQDADVARQRLRTLLSPDTTWATPWLRCCALHLGVRADSIDDGHPWVRDMVARGRGGQGEGSMAGELSIVERVIFLKAVPIFEGIPDAELADVATRMEESRLAPGEEFIHEGDLGTSLFVVVSGEVKVHVGDTELARLGEGAVVGEMAALDPEPRSASVSAVDEVQLFSLERASLFELMSEHEVVSRGIIAVLVDRLRDAAKKEAAR